MGRMGPNISSFITFISSVTLSTTVGTIVRACVMRRACRPANLDHTCSLGASIVQQVVSRAW